MQTISLAKLLEALFPQTLKSKLPKLETSSHTSQTVIGEETRYEDDSVNVDDAGTTVTRYGETSRNLGDIPQTGSAPTKETQCQVMLEQDLPAVVAATKLLQCLKQKATTPTHLQSMRLQKQN